MHIFLIQIKLPFPRHHTESWIQIPKFKIQGNFLYPLGDWQSDSNQRFLKKSITQAVVKRASSRLLSLTGAY